MATMREEIEKYKAQVNSYDAGRPNTAVLPRDDGKFKPAEPVGMRMPVRPIAERAAQSGGAVQNPQRQQISTMANPAGQVDPKQETIYPAVGRAAMAVGNRVANDAVALGRDVAARVEASKPAVRSALRGSEWADADALKPGASRTPISLSMATQPEVEPAAGPVAAPSPQPMSTGRELQFRRANANQAGMRAMDEGGQQMTPEQVRATILKRNGMTGNEVPATARPGLTLSASPASPRTPLRYDGAFSGGGEQAKAEDALFRKRMEVLKADQASGQASRGDYVSPFETNPNRRAELDAQQVKNVENIAARQVGEATTRMLNDQATGLTSDRNLAMMPYEQRRAVINDRRALTDLNANMQAKRLEEEGKAASRADEMARAGMEDSTKRRGQDLEVDVQGRKLTSEERRAMATDATTRRGQDIEQQTNLTNAEIAARSKALDREATLEAARIRKNAPVDRVKLESIKGYNKFIGDQVALRPELQDDPAFLEKAMKMYGLSAADLGTPMMQGATPEDDEDFPSI